MAENQGRTTLGSGHPFPGQASQSTIRPADQRIMYGQEGCSSAMARRSRVSGFLLVLLNPATWWTARPADRSSRVPELQADGHGTEVSSAAGECDGPFCQGATEIAEPGKKAGSTGTERPRRFDPPLTAVGGIPRTAPPLVPHATPCIPAGHQKVGGLDPGDPGQFKMRGRAQDTVPLHRRPVTAAIQDDLDAWNSFSI